MFFIEKEMSYRRREQPNRDIVVMENNGKNPVRDTFDGLHLKKNNKLWDGEDNPPEPQKRNFALVKKNGMGRHKFT